MRCGACGAPYPMHCYRWVFLCYECKRVADAWCWHKLQGLKRKDILPRYEEVKAGQPYLCILCGYWHWTSGTGEPAAGLTEKVWALNRYFERTAFHINIARGWDKIRYLPAGAEN